MTKTITVPDYVAEEFNRQLGHPSKLPNAVDLSCQRVYRLVAYALNGIDWPEWDIDGGSYTSKIPEGLPGLTRPAEPMGFVRVDDRFYIYAEERGRRTAIAIFKNYHMAADYFVWLVSKGKREIDWSLFLEMEP